MVWGGRVREREREGGGRADLRRRGMRLGGDRVVVVDWMVLVLVVGGTGVVEEGGRMEGEEG